jgi:hypothetical protein
MVKCTELEEMVIDSRVKSEKKKKFLEFCKKRIYEAIDIWTEEHPEFNSDLSVSRIPHSLVIFSSEHYDAEIRAGRWCYIDFVATNNERKYRVNIHRTDREIFIFDYRGQEFLIHYDKIPRSSKK